MILSITIVTTLLLIWFKTDAVSEYLWFLPISKKYKQVQASNPGLDFIMFLTMSYKGFWIRLLACPYCIGFWLALGISLFTSPVYVPIIYIGALVLYKLI